MIKDVELLFQEVPLNFLILLRCIICDRVFIDDDVIARAQSDGTLMALMKRARALMCDECLKLPRHKRRLGAHELYDLAEHIRRK